MQNKNHHTHNKTKAQKTINSASKNNQTVDAQTAGIQANTQAETSANLNEAIANALLDLVSHTITSKQADQQTIDLQQVVAMQWQASTENFGQKSHQLCPIVQSKNIQLNDLQGIETQKAKLIQNTEQFLAGLPANHVLLTGTRGAGKSSVIRALLNDYADKGLRLIEVAKNDLASLSKLADYLENMTVKDETSDQPYRFIIYCDDLAFSKEDADYRMLKTMLDGSIASFGDRFLIYATSNRRHLLPQYMQDNLNIYEGRTDEVNPLEQVDETVSLSDRFGIWLSFHPMTQSIYLDIVEHELQKADICYDDNVKAEALKWASSRGGRSGRVAFQFSQHWIGQFKLIKLLAMKQ